MGITILLGTFLVFVVIGIPLCYSLGASAAAYFIIAKPAFMGIFAQRIWSGSCSYVLIALPLFILAGEVNVIASMIFGGITGSSVADTSAIGSVLVPEMERAGYHKGFSAGVAVLYAALLGFFVYRELDMGQLREILKKTVLSSSAVMFVVGFSTIYVWILSVEQVPATVGNFLLNLDVDRIWILLPVMRGIGVGELQFGAIMITGLAIGLVTPPVGMCLNACNKICRMSITDIFMHALPFILCNLLVLLMVTFVPAISTWLPALAR